MGVGADQELGQQKPIKLNKKFQCGGMIGDDFVVIGASDGELLFLKLDSHEQQFDRALVQ
jgi:hypothetical protein